MREWVHLLMVTFTSWLAIGYRFWLWLGLSMAIGGFFCGVRGQNILLFFLVGVFIAVAIDMVIFLFSWRREGRIM